MLCSFQFQHFICGYLWIYYAFGSMYSRRVGSFVEWIVCKVNHEFLKNDSVVFSLPHFILCSSSGTWKWFFIIITAKDLKVDAQSAFCPFMKWNFLEKLHQVHWTIANSIWIIFDWAWHLTSKFYSRKLNFPLSFSIKQ